MINKLPFRMIADISRKEVCLLRYTPVVDLLFKLLHQSVSYFGFESFVQTFTFKLNSTNETVLYLNFIFIFERNESTCIHLKKM